MKALIFDSGTLINLSMNGLLYILEGLKRDFDGKFLITQKVKYETIDRPVGIQRFELGALGIKDLIDTGVIEMSTSMDVDESELNNETKILMDSANHFMQIKGKWVHLVEEAEMSCLALSKELSKRGINCMIAVDERTTRMLSENPENLLRIMSEKLHQKIQSNPEGNESFSQYKFIRSTEIAYVAYKKGLIKLKGNRVLEAVLYATKFKGSSVSLEEIDILKKL